jgi:hypothetical protein
MQVVRVIIIILLLLLFAEKLPWANEGKGTIPMQGRWHDFDLQSPIPNPPMPRCRCSCCPAWIRFPLAEAIFQPFQDILLHHMSPDLVRHFEGFSRIIPKEIMGKYFVRAPNYVSFIIPDGGADHRVSRLRVRILSTPLEPVFQPALLACLLLIQTGNFFFCAENSHFETNPHPHSFIPSWFLTDT